MGNLLLKSVEHSGYDALIMNPADQLMKPIWDIEVTDIDGNQVELREMVKGARAVIFVNVATKWGLTERDYNELVTCHKKFREQGLEIVAFPCDQFKNQEPGTNAEIRDFVRTCYNVEFPLCAKSNVNGPETNETYKWLRSRSELFNAGK